MREPVYQEEFTHKGAKYVLSAFRNEAGIPGYSSEIEPADATDDGDTLIFGYGLSIHGAQVAVDAYRVGQCRAKEHTRAQLVELVKTIVPDYPGVEHCGPDELIYAIRSSFEGITAGNADCHGVIRELQRRLGCTPDEMREVWESVMGEKEVA